MSKISYVIGIDPGKKTGVAGWSIERQQLEVVKTCGIIEAMEFVISVFSGRLNNERSEILIRFEDSRLRTWFGNSGREKLQGTGSIKRDSSIWQEFCEHHDITYEAVMPAAGSTKWKPDYFKKVTGWQGRTSEHSRDAACLVLGIKGAKR